MKVTADREVCVGAGQCVFAAGEVFDQDEDGLVVVLQEHPGPAEHENAEEAALTCPSGAIHID